MLNEKEVKNMNNVNLGQEFKNYKELCAYLGEQEKGGKSKDLQIKDWERYFSFEKQGHKFIITDVYDIPKEKVRKQRKVEDKPRKKYKTENYTSNNIKNIKPMIELLSELLGTCEYDGEFYSYTSWYCDVLSLFDKKISDSIYNSDERLEKICNSYHISNACLYKEYISTTKSLLKDMLLKSLKYLDKKDLIRYDVCYQFGYKLGKRTSITGRFVTECLNDVIQENESLVCDAMNEEHNLSNKMKGRQLLFMIYNKEHLTNQFTDMKLESLMKDKATVDKMNDCLIDYMVEYEGKHPDEITRIDKDEHPLLYYNQGIRINNIIDDLDRHNPDDLRKQIAENLCNRVRLKMKYKHYTHKWTGEIIYPYQYCESDFDKIEKLLYNCKKENDISFDDLPSLSEDEDKLFSQDRFIEREDYDLNETA